MNKKIQIKRRYTEVILFESESGSLKDAVLAAIRSGANLEGANLSGANLSGANLSRANLNGASLCGANLEGANLEGASLYGANLSRANLYGANLYGANLSGADLEGANLYGANLYGANLSGADLSRASLEGANLEGANLYGADLNGASLEGANLEGANLYGADLNGAKISEEESAIRSILPKGDLIGWKKLYNGSICKLRIPATAKRVGGLIGRKCRAEFVEVLEGTGESDWDRSVTYVPGSIVRPKEDFNPDPRVECASGIHFYITRQEAEKH